MHAEILDFLVPALLAMSAFRLIPFVAHALVSRRVGGRGKLVAVGAGLALVGALQHVEPSLLVALLWAFGAFGYFCGVAALAWYAAPRLPRSGTAGLAFACSIVLCLGVPAAVMPTRYAMMGLVPGWEVMLSAFSFVRDSARAGRRSTLADAVFFICVDPVLVFAQRARPSAASQPTSRAVLRIGLGLATLALHLALLSQLNRFEFVVPRSYGAIVGVCGLAFLCTYFGHSGVASVQIGIMRGLGYALPERYDFPLLATGPLDFWNRWNTYVGQWLRRYVFQPLVLRLRRGRRRGWLDPAAMSLAVLTTFLVGGALHDVVQVGASGQLPFASTLAFAVHGLSALAWLGAGPWLGMPATPVTAPPRMLPLIASRLGLAHVLLAANWVRRAVGDGWELAISVSGIS